MSLFGVREFKLDIGGKEMTCISFGKGGRPLVIIPGLRLSSAEGSGLLLAWYYRIFLKDYRLYLFDRKKDLAEGCTVHDLAEDVAAGMRLCELRDADVIGVSQGGMIAQDLAICHPELVHKLVLGMTLSRSNPTVETAVSGWLEMAERNDFGAIVRDYVERGYSELYRKRYRLLLPLLLKTQKITDKEQFLIQAKACLTCNTYDRLGEISCPVLVLGGGKDRIVSGEASREIAAKLGCECHMYEDLSHEAYNEAKDFNPRILRFLKAAE